MPGWSRPICWHRAPPTEALAHRLRSRRLSGRSRTIEGNRPVKVLVIEDDAETAAYILRGLREHGHVAEHAADGRGGLFMAGNGAYDVLVVDRMLPGLDGLSLVRTLRAADV